MIKTYMLHVFKGPQPNTCKVFNEISGTMTHMVFPLSVDDMNTKISLLHTGKKVNDVFPNLDNNYRIFLMTGSTINKK